MSPKRRKEMAARLGGKPGGARGPVTGFDPVSAQRHHIFPAVDLNVSPKWEINFGLGVGVTHSTDHLIAKIILGYRFNF